jgi:2-oxoglutarate ferredoxin oxidoreductase subunit gamma
MTEIKACQPVTDTSRIVFSGSGGQGIIMASIILAEGAVMYEGLNAVQTQTYGPEARGGSTRADVVISKDPIRYPKVIHPHILVCLTQEAYNRFSEIVRPGGLLLTDSHFVKHERKVDARQVELGMHRAVMDKIGNSVVFNMCMLGAMIGLTGLVKAESIIKVLETRVPPDLLGANKKGFQLGLVLAESVGRKA